MRNIDQRVTRVDEPTRHDLDDLPSAHGDFPNPGRNCHQAVRVQRWRFYQSAVAPHLPGVPGRQLRSQTREKGPAGPFSQDG